MKESRRTWYPESLSQKDSAAELWESSWAGKAQTGTPLVPTP